jgi:hypothetical protein
MAGVVLVFKDLVQFERRIFGCLLLWYNKNWQYQIPLILKNYVRIFEKFLSLYDKHFMLADSIAASFKCI